MNRREFTVGAACVLATTALGVPGAVFAQPGRPQDGAQYLTLKERVTVEAPPGKIEVVEFFWYSCPHCNAFEPRLEAWIKKLPPDVVMRRVPVAFRDDFVPQQRLFYSLEAMGKLDELHNKVFREIHDGHSPINREDLIVAWAEKQGLDKVKFREHYNSFTVSTKARRAIQLQDAFKVTGVPSIGVAGRFYTDGELAGNMELALEVTDFLIAEARKLR
ncbi:MAG: thiol:disulfide interchange protein DsbA/DsbL [Ramlibacter sp.]